MNIPNQKGVESATRQLYTDNNNPPLIPKQEMREKMDIVLGRNYFEFNNNIYQQKRGVAMGTKFAVSFANIFMGRICGIHEYAQPRA